MEQQPSFYPELGKKPVSTGVKLTIKLVTIGILLIVFLIPKFMIMSLVNERADTSEAARETVTDKWAKGQTLRGPILKVPYEVYKEDSKGIAYQELHDCYFLPKTLAVSGELAPRELHQSIYQVIVYESKLTISGHFEAPDFGRLKVEPQSVRWDKAELLLAVADLRGVSDAVSIEWNGKAAPFVPDGSDNNLDGSCIAVDMSDSALQTFPADFRFALSLKGSERLHFAPVGETTSVSLASPWNDPQFSAGYYLPDEREISATGFSCKWQISSYNRNFPQEWTDDKYDIDERDFGVDLVTVADHYQKSLRCVKYSSLIILLIFLAFFLNEALTAQRVHQFQYILVGCAIMVFYVLQLSLSEHTGFNPAYLLSTFMTLIMVLLYSRTFLNTWANSLILTGILALSLGFVFVLLQLENYALLAGSLGLFAVLSATMFFTRKIRWYETDNGKLQ